jgi:hypothetical protein
MGKKRPKQCRYCETAIEQEPTDAGAWYHSWSGLGQCRRISTRQFMDSYAAPRPEK